MKTSRSLFKFLTVFLLLAAAACFFGGCHFFTSLDAVPEVKLTFDKSSIVIKCGQVDVINLRISENQNNASVTWSYDDEAVLAVTDNYSAVITGLKPGVTVIKASSGGKSVTCSITVTQEVYQPVTSTNPYVYASDDIVSVSPGTTKKISASLFGGTNADINGFIWSIDKPSVATISTEGNYCWITGISDGTARISVRHNKASYPYSVLVNCSADGKAITYLTTDTNIINLNLDTRPQVDFAVSLVNPSATDNTSSITYSLVNMSGELLQEAPVSVSSYESVFNITAAREGDCYLRISHPSCIYPLDVFVRVTKNASLAYIEPSSTLVTVTDSESELITVSIAGASEPVDPSLFTWSFSPNASYYADYTVYNGTGSLSGDRISFKGKKPGSLKATVSYPGLGSRDIAVIVKNINSVSSDAQCYISTDRNFINCTVSDDAFILNAFLHNSFGSAEDFVWAVSELPADGVTGHVISITPDRGITTSVSRAALVSNSVSNFALITPENPGTAYIDISHPDALYPTRVTVIVGHEKIARPDTPAELSYGSSPVIHILNGSAFNASVILSGASLPDPSLTSWTSSGDITLSPSGTDCIITAPSDGSGVSSSVITVSHPDVSYSRIINVYCADDIEQFDEFEEPRYIYTNRSFVTVSEDAEEEQSLLLCTCNLSREECSGISWDIISGEDCISWYVSENVCFQFMPLTAGTVEVRASHPLCPDSVYFTITVFSASSYESDSSYLESSDSVLFFTSVNQTKSFSIVLHDSPYTNYADTVYELSSDDFEYTADGNVVTVRSLTDTAEGTITVSHPLSRNVITVYLKNGERYVYRNEDVSYISVDKDNLTLMPGSEATVTACLIHSSSPDIGYEGFAFSSDKPDVADVRYVRNTNTCTIIPKKNGVACITVSNDASSFTKEIIVIVGAENAGTIPYLTSENNIVSLLQGDTSMVSVSISTSEPTAPSSWHWVPSDVSIVNVITSDGGTAMFRGMKPGTAKVTVSNDICEHPLEIIVTVLDSASVKSKPYITSSTNIITVQKGSSSSFTVNLAGNDYDSADSYFRFSCSNPAIALLDSSSNSARVQGLNTGSTVITVTNTLFPDCYSKTVLVIVEDSAEKDVYIIPSSTVLKLAPDSGLTKLTATLGNGSPSDYDDFIFWADDPSLISLSTVSNQCSIIPTGRSGTTKVHIKHRKAEKQSDVIVLISKYDNFAFSASSTSVVSGKFSFLPLQVPSFDEEVTIEYTSSDEDTVIATGSSSVAWLCGINPGTATVTATLKNLSGETLASADLFVSVSLPDLSLPEVILGNSVVTVFTGDTQTFSAVISGSTYEGEVYSLSWDFRDNPSGVDVINGSCGHADGASCTATFLEEGEYVLTCTHPCGVSSDIVIVCNKKGELAIELNTYLEQLCVDDGLFELTATVNNGSPADEDSITWAALKSGGKNIVSISKASGNKCIVIPKAVGQTVVIAKLPDGHSASCTVLVKPSAELIIGVGTVHVIPGYTETVRYRTVPDDAYVNWIPQMNGVTFTNNETYFTVADDPVKKELKITGVKDYPGSVAGTITGMLSGASSAKMPVINVCCEYNVELRLEKTNGTILTQLKNNKPETSNPVSFDIVYYPADLDVDLMLDGSIVKCFYGNGNHSETEPDFVSVGESSVVTFEENGYTKARRHVTLIPHKEVTGKTFTVTATLPTATSCSKSEDFTYTACYDSYNIELELFGDNNRLSNYAVDSNGVLTLNIASGEDVSLSFRITDENATGKIKSVTSSSFTFSDQGFNRSSISVESQASLVPGTSLYKFTYKPSSLSTGGSDSKFYFNDDEKNNTIDVTKSDCLDKATTDYFLVIREPMYNGKYLIPHNSSKENISGYSLLKFSVSSETGAFTYSNVYEKRSHASTWSAPSTTYWSDGHGGFSFSGPADEGYEYTYHYDKTRYTSLYLSSSTGEKILIADYNGKYYPGYTYTVCKPYIITRNELMNNTALWCKSSSFEASYNEYHSGEYYYYTYPETSSYTSSSTTTLVPNGYDGNGFQTYKEVEVPGTTYYGTAYSTWKYCHTSGLRSSFSPTYFAGIATDPSSESVSPSSRISEPYHLLIPASGANQCIVPYYCPDPKQSGNTKHSGTLTINYTLADGKQKTYNIPVILTEYDILTKDEDKSESGGGELAYSWDKWEKITVKGADGKNYDRWILKDN